MQQTIEQWRIAFWFVFVTLVGTNILYLIWGSGDQQWWDDIEKLGYPEDWKHGPLQKNPKNLEKTVIRPIHDHPDVVS